MMELTKEMLASDHKQHMHAKPSTEMFSEPSHFPENIMLAGGGYHDDITAGMASPEQLQEIYDQLKHDLEMQVQAAAASKTFSFDSAAAERFHLDPNLDEMATKAFSEASTFPEFTPSEDGLFAQAHGAAPSTEELELRAQILEAQEEPITRAQSSLLSEMPSFSEPSDFPECPIVEEIIAARKRAA
jgi:hypothetical protein